MIVNTAYIYMGVGGGGGGGGGTPANPNLWKDGVSNYPVVFTDSKITASGLNFISVPGEATFSELTLTQFNSLTLSGRTSSQQGLKPKVEIGIEFYSSDNVLIGTTTATFSKSGNSVTVDIASSAKIQNAKIKIKKAAYGFPSTLSSAVLS